MEAEKIIKNILGEFFAKLRVLPELQIRDAHFPDAPDKIKVAIGMRRAGKTSFVYQTILNLLKSGIPQSHILYINFEDDRLIPLKQQKLAQLIEAFYSIYPENHDRKCYLFLDEIQNVEDWPIVIRRIHDTKQVELYLTGSSGKLLSKEIATSLRGRSLSTEIWPFSFHEYCAAKKIEVDRTLYYTKTRDQLRHLFTLYLSEGGFPEVVPYTPDVRQATLQEYIDVVIFRDIIERHKVQNPSVIKYLILSLIQNAGKPFSVNKFFNDLKTQGYTIGKDALYEYVNYIEDAYLAFSVPLYDLSVRKMQVNPKKSYCIDPGMARAVTLNYDKDLGRLFENVVFLDLKRRGLNVSYYMTEERHEVDFLVQTARGSKKLLQVVWELDGENQEREERALEEAKRELKVDGEIVTLDSYLEFGLPEF